MYDELIIKYEYLKKLASEEELIKKIIELNFNEIEIKYFYDTLIYEELEDEYGISGFTSKEEALAKIKELNFDRSKINDWVEDTLINGN